MRASLHSFLALSSRHIPKIKKLDVVAGKAQPTPKNKDNINKSQADSEQKSKRSADSSAFLHMQHQCGNPSHILQKWACSRKTPHPFQLAFHWLALRNPHSFRWSYSLDAPGKKKRKKTKRLKKSKKLGEDKKKKSTKKLD